RIQELLAALVKFHGGSEKEISDICTRLVAVECKVSVRRARITLIDLQIAELAAKLEGVPTHPFLEPVGNVPSVVWLKRGEVGHTEGEVLEVFGRHSLRKSRRS